MTEEHKTEFCDRLQSLVYRLTDLQIEMEYLTGDIAVSEVPTEIYNAALQERSNLDAFVKNIEQIALILSETETKEE